MTRFTCSYSELANRNEIGLAHVRDYFPEFRELFWRDAHDVPV